MESIEATNATEKKTVKYLNPLLEWTKECYSKYDISELLNNTELCIIVNMSLCQLVDAHFGIKTSGLAKDFIFKSIDASHVIFTVFSQSDSTLLWRD